MFKNIYYLFALLLINISSTLAMDGEPPTPGKMTVHLKNQLPALEADKLDHIRIKKIGPTLPYVLRNSSDSTTYLYVTDIKVLVTILDKNGKSSSILKPLPAEQGILTCELPFDDRTQLDRISMQIQGRSFKAGTVDEDGELRCEGDYMFVDVGSTWHSLKQNEKGWLYGDSLDSLYSYFTLDNRFKGHIDGTHPYRVAFGNRPLS